MARTVIVSGSGQWVTLLRFEWEWARFLTNDERNLWLFEVTMVLYREMLMTAGLAHSKDAALVRALDSGEAAERFCRMVAAQGSPAL